jgi:uncharacterized protein YukE
MSASFENQSFHLNLEAEPASELQALLARVQMLRDEIINAWRDRGVTLTRSEQARLHAEITDTCKLLSDLTLTH